jgi:catechol-2,3-dioxygenase
MSEDGRARAGGIGLKRLQHLVLWVSDVERSVRFYCDVLGFEVKTRYPNAAFLRIAGSAEDHHLGLFEQRGATAPAEGAARMYHAAWEVGELTDLVCAQHRLIEAGSLVGQSDHGVSLSLYAKDPDGLEFEVFWTVPGGEPVRTRALDLPGELARRGIRLPEEAKGR